MAIQMKVIVNVDSLYNLIYSNQENVLYPVGVEGNSVIDLLRFTGVIQNHVLRSHWITQRISCIATAKLQHQNAQMFIHGVPLLQVDHLPHFRETGIFIIAAPPQQREGIYQYLTQFGCKNIFVIGDDAQREVQQRLQEIYRSGQAMQWFADHFDQKLEELQYRIDAQNEVCAVNSKAFEHYRNRFRGKKVVIFATGPTSAYYKPIPGAIHIGVNYAWRREDIPVDILFFNDGAEQQTRDAMEPGFDKIPQAVFVGRVVNWLPYCWSTYPEYGSIKWQNLHRFYIEDSIECPLYQDICYHPLISNATMAFPTIQFALFTYPKELYLVGCDLGTVYEHFYDQEEVKGNERLFPSKDRIKVTYARLKMFARKHYPDTEIISINPVGLKGLFKDIYTDEYTASLKKQ